MSFWADEHDHGFEHVYGCLTRDKLEGDKMGSEYLVIKGNIIEELNKHREVQKELMARRDMLKHWADITSKDYDEVVNRLQETSDIIQKLKDKL